MDSQFESRVPYRRSMFGRRAFSSDKEVYQFGNEPGLRTYSGNLSMMYNYGDPNQISGLTPTTPMTAARRYSLQAGNYDPILDASGGYQSQQTTSGYGTNTICDNNFMIPRNTSSLLTNERILPYVPSAQQQTTSGSFTSNMVLSNQLNNHLVDTLGSSSSLHQQQSQQRLMPRLPFKSHSTESKLIGGQSTSGFLRTKPIVEPDDYYDSTMETTFTSGRRLSGHFGYTPTYQLGLSKSKLNESLQRRQLNQLDRLDSRLVDTRLDAMNGANYLAMNSIVNTNQPQHQPAANYIDATSSQPTVQANASGFGLVNSAKNSFLSGSMSSLVGNREPTNTINPNLSNIQVPSSMNYLNQHTSDYTNSASNTSLLTNVAQQQQQNVANSFSNPIHPHAYVSSSVANVAGTKYYGTNRHLNSAANRILLRQESDQTDMRKSNRLHSSASYSYGGGGLSGPSALLTGDNYTSVNQSRASTIKPNYLNSLKFDKRNRLKYQLSFSSAEEDPDEEFHSSDCSLDYDDNYLVQVKKPSYRTGGRRKMMNYKASAANSYALAPNSAGHFATSAQLYGGSGGGSAADECLDDDEEYENSIDERYNLRNRRQQFRLTHGSQQYFNDLGCKVQSKFLLLSPITWQPSEDGHYMIGHIVLNNSLIQQLQHQRLSSDEVPLFDNENYANVLGLKVIDGNAYGVHEGAIVEKVNSGSIASLIAKLRKGDKILKWNRTFLVNKSYQEIYDIINESKHEPQLELVVERKRPGSFTAQAGHHHLNHGSFQSVGHSFESKLTPSNRLNKNVELPPCSNGQARNTFCRVILIPDKFKKRTKLVVGSNEPFWNQSFVYPAIKRSDLKNKLLEIKIFHLDEYSTELLGCVLIELSSAPLENESEWYLLESYEEILGQLRQYQKFKYLSVDRLSPCSTVSCLSDSDLSELDLVEYHSELTYSKNKDTYPPMLLADTSQSSFGTSISSPAQLHLKQQQCPTQIQLPSTSASGYNNLAHHPSNLGFSTHDAKALFRRRHSPKPPYYSSSMPNPNNSLQNNLLGSINSTLPGGALPPTAAPANINSRFGLVNNRIRPQFRKCQSQPSRSLSPGSIRSYSPLLFDPLNPAANQFTLNRMCNRPNEMNALASRTNSPLKRQLPQPPNLNSNLNMNLNVTNYNLLHQHPASFDSAMMDSGGGASAYQTMPPLPMSPLPMQPLPMQQPVLSTGYSQQQPTTIGGFPALAGHSNSALSNYEINRYKQFSKSSMMLPYNRSLDGVRSPQGMYSDSELNRQYHHPSSSFGYRSQHLSQPFRPTQPLFYHQYHRDGDYTTLSRQEMEEEMNRNLHRHAKGKQKQQTYYTDVNDAREEQKYLKDQHPAKHHHHHQQSQEQQLQTEEGYDAETEQQPLTPHTNGSSSARKRSSVRKSSIDEVGDQYEKSFDGDSRLQPTDGAENGSRHGSRKTSGHHLPDENHLNAITSVDQHKGVWSIL